MNAIVLSQNPFGLAPKIFKFMMIPARYFAGLRQSSIQQVYQ